MAKSFLYPIDLNGLELQNARFHNLATAPANPAIGRFYYNTSDNTLYAYVNKDGTDQWVDVISSMVAHNNSMHTETYATVTQVNTAEADANNYTDGEISSLDTSLKAYADQSQTDAEDYADAAVTTHQNLASPHSKHATLDGNNKVPLAELPDLAKQSTHVVADIAARDALTGLIEGDKAFITDLGDSYIWDGTDWVLMADADWENVNLQWSNINDTPTTLSGYGITDAASLSAFNSHTGSGGSAHAAVTTTTNGFMSSGDKSKLNGIANSANNYSHPNHTGDVTSSGDGATTIATNAVTNAKLADMAANTIKGVSSAGSPTDLSATQVRSILNVADGANNYSHPSQTAIDQTLSTATVLASFETNSLGHVTSLTTRTLTPANIGAESAFSKNSAFNKNFETSTDNIEMNGSVSVGTSSNIARADHVHPVDTSRAAASHNHTWSHLPNSSENTLIGRLSGTGSVSALTPGDVRGILNVADGANNYSHPSDGGGTRTSLSGATVINGITVNSAGHVTATTVRNLSYSNIGAAAASHSHDWGDLPYTPTRSYSTSVGNGSSTSFTVTHNLGTRDVQVTVREAASPYAIVDTLVEVATTSAVTVKFATAPSSSEYRVTVVG